MLCSLINEKMFLETGLAPAGLFSLMRSSITAKIFDIVSERNASFTLLSCASGNFATSTENANARAGPISSAPSR